jgi:hypothetical protein
MRSVSFMQRSCGKMMCVMWGNGNSHGRLGLLHALQQQCSAEPEAGETPLPEPEIKPVVPCSCPCRLKS